MDRRLFMKFGVGIPFLSSWMRPDRVHARPQRTEYYKYPSELPGTTMTITSRKGGVGKTAITGNLGVCLSRMGHKVLVVDQTQDLVFSEIFGMLPNVNTKDEYDGEREISDLLNTSEDGVDVLKASYEDMMVNENKPMITKIFSQYDVRLVDAATSSSIPVSLRGGPMVGEIIVVTTPEPASILTTYSWLKEASLVQASYDHVKSQHYRLIVNNVQKGDDGQAVNKTLRSVSSKHLGCEFDYLGFISADSDLKKSISMQKPVVSSFPEATSSIQFQALAASLVERKIC